MSLPDGVPIYRQVVNQGKYPIASGQLDEGKELLANRKLAEQLLVTPCTVAKAYPALESEGLIFK